MGGPAMQLVGRDEKNRAILPVTLNAVGEPAMQLVGRDEKNR